MKQILLLMLLMPGILTAQKNKKNKKNDDLDSVTVPAPIMPLVDSLVVYSDVVNVDSAGKVELYERAKRFFVINYKSANDVIQLDDKENGEITGKGGFKVTYNQGIAGHQPTNVSHIISIAVKDGRYKYTIYNLRCNYYSSGTTIGTSYIKGYDVNNPMELYAFSKIKMLRRYATDVNKEITEFITGMKLFMAKKGDAKKDDW